MSIRNAIPAILIVTWVAGVGMRAGAQAQRSREVVEDLTQEQGKLFAGRRATTAETDIR